MGFGSTAKKLQKVADLADDLYTKVSELKTQLQSLQGTVDETNDGVADIERELAEQRAVLEALAEQQDIDVDAITAAVDADGADDAPDNADTTDGDTVDDDADVPDDDAITPDQSDS